MKPYSLDLRQKIVGAVDSRMGTYEEIAEMFGVHVTFINKLLRLRRETGDIVPRPHGGGAILKLNEEALEVLAQLVYEQPDATLEELRTRLRKRTKVDVSVPTICRGLKKLGLTLKKRPSSPRKPIQTSEKYSRKNNCS